MEWVSPDFCDRVFHLLFKSSIKAFRDAIPSRTWAAFAKIHLKKRVVYHGRFGSCCFRSELKENPFARITSVIFMKGEGEFAFKALPYLATDDNSRFRLWDVQKSTHLEILSKVDSIGCFFSKINDLPYHSPLSMQFLKKHIEKGVLQEVSLATGWRKKEAQIIRELLLQKQLISFNSVDARGLMFDEGTVEKLLSALMNRPSKKRCFEFRVNCDIDCVISMIDDLGCEQNPTDGKTLIRSEKMNFEVCVNGKDLTLNQR